MNNYLKIAFTIVINYCFIHAQSLTDLEIKYEQVEKEYVREIVAVDSLGALVLRRAAAIDSEKKKKNPDEDKIIELMSGSASLSNDLEKHRKKAKNLEENLEQIKQRLYKRYTTIIDSLQNLNKSALHDEIFFYTERRLMVSPKIPVLSFNPQKILKIDMTKIKDSGEKILYKEYINNAFSEVSNLIESIENESGEIEQIAALEKRTRRFLEDTEFESGVIPRSISRETEKTSELGVGVGWEGRNGDGAVTGPENVVAYNSLLNQLNPGSIPAQNFSIWPVSDFERNMSLEDYQKLLKEVKLRLQELKLVLENKISAAK